MVSIKKYIPFFYSDLLTNKKDICEKQMVNFKDFLDKLEKCKVILIKERIWIIFKSKDKEEKGCLSPDETLSILKENFPKVNFKYYIKIRLR